MHMDHPQVDNAGDVVSITGVRPVLNPEFERKIVAARIAFITGDPGVDEDGNPDPNASITISLLEAAERAELPLCEVIPYANAEGWPSQREMLLARISSSAAITRTREQAARAIRLDDKVSRMTSHSLRLVERLLTEMSRKVDAAERIEDGLDLGDPENWARSGILLKDMKALADMVSSLHRTGRAACGDPVVEQAFAPPVPSPNVILGEVVASETGRPSLAASVAASEALVAQVAALHVAQQAEAAERERRASGGLEYTA